MTTTADLLNEYGSALRGAWGDIDGRSERIALDTLADAIREHGTKRLSSVERARLRDALGVCLAGHGHWQEFCVDFDEEEPVS